MKVFATKCALTDGVQEIEVETPDENGLCADFARFSTFYRLGKDCFVDRSEAVADAEKRRKAKIASVKKQLAKLEAMTF